MIELHYFPNSHWSRAITLVLAEKGLSFERTLVDIRKNASFEPNYIGLNPRGVVPTLVHDGRVVTNGPTIAAYLDTVGGPPLCRPETASWARRMEEFPLMLFSYSVWVLGKRGERSASILDDKVSRAERYAAKYPEHAAAYERKKRFFETFRDEVNDDEHVARQSVVWGETLDELSGLVETHGMIHDSGYSFADAIATSVLYRLRDLKKLDDWVGADHPLQRYLERLEARPSFGAVFRDDPLLASL